MTVQSSLFSLPRNRCGKFLRKAWAAGYVVHYDKGVRGGVVDEDEEGVAKALGVVARAFSMVYGAMMPSLGFGCC